MAQGNKPVPITDVLKSVFSQIEGGGPVWKEDVEAEWKSLAGPETFKHSRPAVFKNGILTVLVDTSGWMQELSMKKRQLLKALKRKLGKDKIAEIHFKIGEF